MSTILPSGTVEFEFLGFKLHGITSDITDDVQWRIAVHEFDRRDGAQTENMGRAPWQMRATVLWIDEGGFGDARNFVAALEKNPSGLLIHPLYGKRQATCSGFQGASLRVSEANTYTMPLTWTENSLDAKIVGTQAQGVDALAQAVNSQASTTLTLAEPYG